MNRRQFNQTVAFTAAAPFLQQRSKPLSNRVNGDRLNTSLMLLSKFGRNTLGGVDRVAYSEADLQGREMAMRLMRSAGLAVRVDASGNIIGAREAGRPGLPVLALGSHIDSVPQGGNYDGDVGALGAIEVATTLLEQRIPTWHPMEFIIFANEEGGQTGARAMAGRLAETDLDRVSSSGKTLREGIAFIGGDPNRLDEVRRVAGDLKAYLELHIEQGPILDSEGIQIGVVEGIVGIHRWMVTVTGFSNHAGTTPMNRRQDALLAAAEFIQLVNRRVRSESGRQVGTVGWMEVEPGAPNVVPGKVRLTVEMRDLDWPKIDRLFERIRFEAEEISDRARVQFAYEEIYDNPPRLTAPDLQERIRTSSQELGLSYKLMPSGAGHDAQSLSHIVPVGMIFVPSQNGISHSAEEFSTPEAITNGANVLLHTLLKLDQEN